jgi:O-antigen ligase
VYVNPNALGMVAALVVPFALWKSTATRGRPSILWGALCLSAFGSIVAAQARTSLIAAVVGVGLVLIGLLAAGKRPQWRSVSVAIGGVIGCVVMIAVIDAIDLSYGLLGSYRELDTTTSGRVQYWQQAYPVFVDYPIAGSGFRAAESALERGPGSAAETQRGLVHNGVIQTILDLGLVGFVLLVAVVSNAFRGVRARLREPLTGGILGCVAAGMAVQLGESSLFGLGSLFGVAFWLLIGAAEARRTQSLQTT